jgi:hypothetical protein
MPNARRTGLTAAIAAAVLASAAPAPALPPGRSGLYGGGAVGDYLQFVSLRVVPGGGMTAHATLVTSCAPRFADELTESVDVRDVRLTEAGTYSATTSFSDDVDPGVSSVGGLRADGTIAFSVRVLRGGLARGEARVLSTYTDPESGNEQTRCDTGPVPWALRRPAPDAGTGRPRLQAGTHRGTTDQGEPFLMRVTDGGRLVRRAGLTARVDCPGPAGRPLDVVAHLVRVRRGRFGAAGDFRRPFQSSAGREMVERYSWELRGRFGRRGARGTFDMRGVVRRRSDGRRVGSCETGTLAWRASP